jgi:tRNA(adenine34) deaminase
LEVEVDLYHLMRQALEEAEKGLSVGEVPVGAVLAGPDGQIVARAHNQPITLQDPTAHAEILAIRKAGLFFENYRLNNTLLVVTIEPCLMCMGAVINARIARLVFGTPDPKAGAAGSLYNLAADRRLNHGIEVIPGIMEEECRELIGGFFRPRRRKGV